MSCEMRKGLEFRRVLFRSEGALSQRREGALPELMQHFREGTFTPLAQRAFEGREILDAFRLMQQSGHIGKIQIGRAACRERGQEKQRRARGRDAEQNSESA